MQEDGFDTKSSAFRLSDYRELLEKELNSFEIQDLLYDPGFFSSLTVNEELQSALIDKILGIKSHEIEGDLLELAKPYANSNLEFLDHHGHSLHGGTQTWVGLDPESLQTPYPQLWEICENLELRKDEVIVDLGSAFGRLGLVLNCFAPEVKFIGFEYVKQRVEEAKRVFQLYECQMAEIHCVDLADENFFPPAANVYFIYDYGRSDQVRTTLNQLKDLSDKKHDFCVVSRGRSCTSLIEHRHPWLAEVFPKKRFGEVTIFSNYQRF